MGLSSRPKYIVNNYVSWLSHISRKRISNSKYVLDVDDCEIVFYDNDHIPTSKLTNTEEDKSQSDDRMKKAERVVKYNEKDNIPIQTEEAEAETHENAEVEHLADEKEIKRKKED